MKPVTIKMHFTKRNRAPLSFETAIQINDWARPYPEYLDNIVFTHPFYHTCLAKGWTLKSYSWSPTYGG